MIPTGRERSSIDWHHTQSVSARSTRHPEPRFSNLEPLPLFVPRRIPESMSGSLAKRKLAAWYLHYRRPSSTGAMLRSRLAWYLAKAVAAAGWIAPKQWPVRK